MFIEGGKWITAITVSTKIMGSWELQKFGAGTRCMGGRVKSHRSHHATPDLSAMVSQTERILR